MIWSTFHVCIIATLRQRSILIIKKNKNNFNYLLTNCVQDSGKMSDKVLDAKRKNSMDSKEGDMDSGYRSRDRSPLPVPPQGDVISPCLHPDDEVNKLSLETFDDTPDKNMSPRQPNTDVIVKPKAVYERKPFGVQDERAVSRETIIQTQIDQSEKLHLNLQELFNHTRPWHHPSQSENNALFLMASDTSDMRLMVEGRPLYVSRILICIISPVLKRMIDARSREQTIVEIPLIDYKFEDVLEFLYCVYPDLLRDITDKNVMKMLQLAEELKVDSLKKRCETFLLQEITNQNNCISPEKTVVFLKLAEKYELTQLKKTCLKMATHIQSELLENVDEFFELSHLTTSSIFLTRLRMFEEASSVIGKKWREAETHCALYHKSERWGDSLCNKCLAGVGRVAGLEMKNINYCS